MNQRDNATIFNLFLLLNVLFFGILFYKNTTNYQLSENNTVSDNSYVDRYELDLVYGDYVLTDHVKNLINISVNVGAGEFKYIYK